MKRARFSPMQKVLLGALRSHSPMRVQDLILVAYSRGCGPESAETVIRIQVKRLRDAGVPIAKAGYGFGWQIAREHGPLVDELLAR